MIIIGEKINSSISRVAGAIERRDVAYIKSLALRQAKAGAAYLDLNAGACAAGSEETEADCLSFLVNTVMGCTDLPLCLDSPNPGVLSRVISLCSDNGRRVLLNSATFERERFDGCASLAKEHGADILILPMDENGFGETADKRLSLAGDMLDALAGYGIGPERIFCDIIAGAAAADQSAPALALSFALKFRDAFGCDIHLTCGLSNVSYGLPERWAVNGAFLSGAVMAGLDAVILDPTNDRIMTLLKAALLLSGRDEYCMDYISYIREREGENT